MIEWTGERYVPWAESAVLSYEHLSRYLFAKDYAKNKMVLDMACGEGYGSFMLSDVASFVVGIDIDPEAVDHARTKYQNTNLAFETATMSRIPLNDDHCIDLIVCFEALEHMDEHDELISEVKRLLKGGGVFIVSTPDKKTYSDDRKYQNPFHKKELYLDEFESFLKRAFNHVSILGQRVYPTASIFPLSGPSPVHREFAIEQAQVGYRETGIAQRKPMYYIAVCSDAPLDAAAYGSATLFDLSSSLFKNYEAKLATLAGALKTAQQKAAAAGGGQAAVKPAETGQQPTVTASPSVAEETLRAKAERLVEERRYEDALDLFIQLSHKNPDDHVVWNDMGVVYAFLGRYGQAEGCLIKALSLKGDYAEATDNLVAISRLEIKPVTGADAAEKPSSAPCADKAASPAKAGAMSLAQMGMKLFSEGDVVRALKFLNRHRDLNPDDYENLNNLALAQMQAGDYVSARIHLTKALQVKAGYKPALDSMARLSEIAQTR